jgi:hypothetical protein
MTPEEYKYGRGSFRVQFTCGAVFGVFVAVPLARGFAESFLAGLAIFVGTVSVCAFAAGFWRDRFWELVISFCGWTGR